MRSPHPPSAEPAPSRGLSRGTLALLLALLGLLAAAMSLSWYVWRELDDVAIGAEPTPTRGRREGPRATAAPFALSEAG